MEFRRVLVRSFVKKVAPGAITVNLVCFAAGASCYLDETIMAAEGEIDGAAFIGRDFEMDPGDHDWAEGPVVVAKGFSIRHEGKGKLVAEAGRIVRILQPEGRRVGKEGVQRCRFWWAP